MPNTLLVTMTRPELGLGDLNLNDHVNYYVSSQGAMGSTTTWRRNHATSPFVDGGVLVGAVKDLVQDSVTVEVLAGTAATHVGLQNNLKALVDAFSQSYFNITFQWDSAYYTYACQPADYSIDWTQGRAHAQQVQAKFNVTRSPVAINGV